MKPLRDGEWTAPLHSGYLMECCKCGTRHRLKFKVVREGRGQNVLFNARRLK